VREVLRAIRLFDFLASGCFISIEDLARFEKCCAALISDRIRLAFLAPSAAVSPCVPMAPNLLLTIVRLEVEGPQDFSPDLAAGQADRVFRLFPTPMKPSPSDLVASPAGLAGTTTLDHH